MAQTLYSDDFNRPDENPASGWTQVGATNRLQVSRCQLAGTGNWSEMAFGVPPVVFDGTKDAVAVTIASSLSPLQGSPLDHGADYVAVYFGIDDAGWFGYLLAADGYLIDYGEEDIYEVYAPTTGETFGPGDRIEVNPTGDGIELVKNGEVIRLVTWGEMDSTATLEGTGTDWRVMLAAQPVGVVVGGAAYIDDFAVSVISSDTPTFASVDDFAALIKTELTDDERDDVQTQLEIATGLIQDAADGQTIFLVENDIVNMRGTNDERIVLPQQPVVSIASVTLDGVELVEGIDWYLDDDAIRRISNTLVYSPATLDALTTARYAGFGYPFQALQIVYTHGYETIPPLYRTICLEAVRRNWINPGAIVAETTGSESVTYAPYSAPPRGIMLTDAELKAIRKKKGARARGLWIG